MIKMKRLILIALLIIGYQSFSQEEQDGDNKSVIQEYTPSILLKKGQWDIKWFNNLYTETKDLFGPNGTERDVPRNTFFTSTLDIFTGISDNRRVNIGLLLEFKSNVIGGLMLWMFSLLVDKWSGSFRINLFAPAINSNPIKRKLHCAIRLHISLIDNETENGVFLDQDGFIFQNRFFYDYNFPSGDWQLFTELNTEYNFGEQDSLPTIVYD